jgi:protein TonB
LELFSLSGQLFDKVFFGHRHTAALVDGYMPATERYLVLCVAWDEAHQVGLPAPPSVQLPSSDADYLQNPRPPYPPISRRMNEQGKTTVRVLIGADGQPQRAEIAKSSGFGRLDDAALATVMRWRFVPGKRGGVAEAMWFNVPINWVLE